LPFQIEHLFLALSFSAILFVQAPLILADMVFNGSGFLLLQYTCHLFLQGITFPFSDLSSFYSCVTAWNRPRASASWR
jgi:hypothetical protein